MGVRRGIVGALSLASGLAGCAGSSGAATTEGGASCAFADPRLEAEVSLLVAQGEELGDSWRHPFGERWTFYGVRDLTGIECIPELRELRCYDCPIEDLGPLAALEGLSLVSITGARVKDLDALAGASSLAAIELRDGILEDADAILAGGVDFPFLRSVVLAGNQLGDGLAAPELPALVDLNLSGNLLTRAPAMDGVPTLERLILSDNPIAEISGLAALAELDSLEIARAELTSLDALVGLPITDLRLADNQIVDASPLASMPLLEDADLRRNAIVGLAGVESSTIRTLNLADNPLESVAGLRLEVAWELDVSGGQLTSFDGLVWLFGDPLRLLAERNQVVDLAGLAAAPRLSRLALSKNPIDLATLPEGLEIDTIELDETGITSLEPLARVSWKGLSAVDNAITALPELGGPKLDGIHLDLSGNAISDLAPLADLWVYHASTIGLAGNAISDLGPLAGLRFFEAVTLDLSDNAITEFSPLITTSFGDGGRVDLSGNPIVSLDPLAAFKIWGDVALARLPTPPDLSPLAASEAHIGRLDLSANGLTDVSALVPGAPSIRGLDLSMNALVEVPSLAAWSLEEIGLDGNPLTTLGALPATVTSFTCAGCSLTTLDGVLDGAALLSHLDLSDNPLTSLAALGGHVREYEATIRLDRVVGLDLSTLAVLDGEVEISAQECGIADLSPFIGRGVADLRGNPITDLGPIVDAQVLGDGFILDAGPLDLDHDDVALDLYAICAGGLVTIDLGAIRCEPRAGEDGS